MSTPAIRAIGCYPCRCLCLGLVQMTITVPWRRITLQLSQRALTEALTFTGSSIVPGSSRLSAGDTLVSRLPEPVRDATPVEVIRRKLDADPITRQDPDE